MLKKIGRNIILVKSGIYKGEFLIQVDRDVSAEKEVFVFLGLPERIIHRVAQKDVEEGFKNKILQVVEKLPRCVYNQCKKEYLSLLGEQQRIDSNH